MPPSLATLRATAPSGRGWAHEIKFDGYRIQARLDHGDVRLLTRKGLEWSEKFPNIAAAVAKLPAHAALIDGEVVVEDKKGISSFSELQAALKALSIALSDSQFTDDPWIITLSYTAALDNPTPSSYSILSNQLNLTDSHCKDTVRLYGKYQSPALPLPPADVRIILFV